MKSSGLRAWRIYAIANSNLFLAAFLQAVEYFFIQFVQIGLDSCLVIGHIHRNEAKIRNAQALRYNLQFWIFANRLI